MPAPPPISLLDNVALLTDIPELGLSAGEVGAVVEVSSEGAFKVEFCDETGHTYGLHTLQAHQLVRLHTQGHPLRTRLEAAYLFFSSWRENSCEGVMPMIRSVCISALILLGALAVCVGVDAFLASESPPLRDWTTSIGGRKVGLEIYRPSMGSDRVTYLYYGSGNARLRAPKNLLNWAAVCGALFLAGLYAFHC